MDESIFVYFACSMDNKPPRKVFGFGTDEVEYMAYVSITDISQVGKCQFFQISHVFFNIRSRRILKK